MNEPHTHNTEQRKPNTEYIAYESIYIQQIGKTILFEIRMMVTKDTRRVLEI